MTIITGTEYKANQGKYIKRAQEKDYIILRTREDIDRWFDSL